MLKEHLLDLDCLSSKIGKYPVSVCIYIKGTALIPLLRGLQEASGEETSRAAAACSEGAPGIVIDPLCEV